MEDRLELLLVSVRHDVLSGFLYDYELVSVWKHYYLIFLDDSYLGGPHDILRLTV